MSLNAVACPPQVSPCPASSTSPNCHHRPHPIRPAQPQADLAQSLALCRVQQAVLRKMAAALHRLRLLVAASLHPLPAASASYHLELQELAAELASLANTKLGDQPIFTSAGAAIALDDAGNLLIMAPAHHAATLLGDLLSSDLACADITPQTLQRLERATRYLRLDTWIVAENINRLSLLAVRDS